MFSIWIYLAVAAAIVTIALGIGQFGAGLGVAFVIFASTVWAAYSEKRRRSKQS